MAHPFPLFEPICTPNRDLLVTAEVSNAVRQETAVAISVSGGRHSAVAALATVDYLDDVGHRGLRVLIHRGGRNGDSRCRPPSAWPNM